MQYEKRFNMSTDFEKQKELIDTEITSLDDVYNFYLRYFKTFDGTHYFFMKIILMLIEENRELKSKLKLKE